MPEPTVAAILGPRIREARKAAGLSQVTLAQQIDGASQSVVSMWETGERVPGADSLVALARALGVSADWLLGLRD